MVWRPKTVPLLVLAWLVLAVAPALAQAPDLDDLQERAIKNAVKRVAPSVVQIETSGGTDIIPANPRGPQIRKGVGPTTGVVVSPDGYIITSAFNFANKPQKIFVGVQGHKERYVAEVIATDHTRMLTLLKIDASGLVVPASSPQKEVVIGQTAIALGRTLDPNPDHIPSVSIGIVSALHRIWGKAVQTDAKIGPANYGGPLVDLQGRVIGLLVPASPLSDEDTAGVEWYDSGIGFAIPLDDVNVVLPKLRNKQDLRRGLLGITAKSPDWYSVLPVVGTVAPASAAERAGIKAGDTILEVDGHAVVRQAQVMHLLGTKYDGDEVTIKVKHADGKEETIPKIKLSATLTAVANAYLGILPMRDDPELGVEIRYVYEKGPADKAGLKVGDRITRIGAATGPLQPFSGVVPGREQLATYLASQRANTQMQLELKRKAGGKTEVVKVTLGEYANEIPEKLPLESTLKKAHEPLKKNGPQPPAPPKKEEAKKEPPQTGFFSRKNAAADHEYWIYVPEDEAYDPNISYTLVIWLHPIGKGKEKDMKDIKNFWESDCDKRHIILVCPKAENETGWVASEADFIRDVIKEVSSQYTVDRRRVIIHGMGLGGQMAYYMGFHARDQIRGVATTGATLANAPKPQVPNQPLAFFLAVGDKDPVAPGVKDSMNKLQELKYAVIYREIKNMGHQYLSDELAAKAMDDLVNWIDSIDRM